MHNGLTENSKALVACFFEECERQFRFLEQDHGFSYFSGMAELKNGRQIIKPYKSQDIDPPFWITTRYEAHNHDLALEISYGDDAYVIEGYLHHDRVNRFEWRDILWASKNNDIGLAEKMGITSEINLKNTLSHMADSVKNNIDNFTDPPPKIINRALALRAKHLEENIRELYKKNMERASIMAAKAFSSKDYQSVIELLIPFERDISRADQKKLHIAQKKFLAH